jgi:hypothetical protein
MSFTKAMTEDVFLKTFVHNVSELTSDTKTLGETFKIMKSNPINSLRDGERHMSKIRNAIGISKFDENEKLSVKIMDEDEKEKRMINTNLELYSAVDIVTRLAKKYDSLNRRRIELLTGGLVVMSEEELLRGVVK